VPHGVEVQVLSSAPSFLNSILKLSETRFSFEFIKFAYSKFSRNFHLSNDPH